jgi:hypothetical protein
LEENVYPIPRKWGFKRAAVPIGAGSKALFKAARSKKKRCYPLKDRL